MSVAEIVLGIMFAGLIAYALFGGADFGAGIWDLLAGRGDRGTRQRDLIEHSIGPVWEANHVWLIFVLVVLWTGFPPAFAAVASTLYIPFTLAAFGMIARGAAFAFRKTADTLALRRFLGAAFAISSLVTPYFLGAIVGGVASGRVPPGIAGGDVVSSWINPTSALGGVLAVLVCAYLAAVFLCDDARREGQPDLADRFRGQALATAGIVGVVAIVGIFVLRSDAPLLYEGLLGRGLPAIGLSVIAGLVSIGLLLSGRYVAARVTAALAVTAILCGWAFGQYPYVLAPHLTIEAGAASDTVLSAMLISILAGSVILLPALVYMYRLFNRPSPAVASATGGYGGPAQVAASAPARPTPPAPPAPPVRQRSVSSATSGATRRPTRVPPAASRLAHPVEPRESATPSSRPAGKGSRLVFVVVVGALLLVAVAAVLRQRASK